MTRRTEDASSPLEVTHHHPDLRVDERALTSTLSLVLEREGRSIGSLSVILTDHETVLELNRRYLQHDYLTDVLSFPLGADDASDVVEGEIYIDLDTAAERHTEFGMSFDEEVRRYAIHGLLHLIGYDDATPKGAEAMERLEEVYLRTAGNAPPL